MGETYQVSIVRYERPGESVQKAVELCNGFETLQSYSRVFIKPNVVFWTTATAFPKWGDHYLPRGGGYGGAFEGPGNIGYHNW